MGICRFWSQGVVALFTPVLISVVGDEEMFRIFVNHAVLERIAEQVTILLDVLTEDNNYHAVESLPIKSPFLLTEGPDVLVKVPCKADLLGDKLTAFAPHTTGIPSGLPGSESYR